MAHRTSTLPDDTRTDDTNTEPICSKTRLCAKLLSLAANPSPPNSDPDPLHRAAGRFRKWCEASGAHLSGPQSLDDRLRDASKIKSEVLLCLDSIEASLKEEESDTGKPQSLLYLVY
jgi:hypothetical protein